MIKINPESHVNVLYYLVSMKHPFPHVAPRWWEPLNAILHVHHCGCSLWRVSPTHVQQVSQTFSYDPSHWKWKTHALMLEFRKRLVYTWSYFSPEVNLCNSLSLRRGTDCNVGWMMSFIYWTQLTTISVTISRFLCIRITDSNVTKLGYNEHPLKICSFFCIFLISVNGIQYNNISILSSRSHRWRPCEAIYGLKPPDLVVSHLNIITPEVPSLFFSFISLVTGLEILQIL